MTTTVPLSGALLPCARQRGSVSTSLTTAVPQRQLPHHCCEIPRLIPTPPSPTARWLSCAEQEPVGVPTVKSPAATPRSRKKRRAAILEPFHAWLRGTASTESVWVNEHPRSDDAVKPPRPLDIGFRLPTDAHRDARDPMSPYSKFAPLALKWRVLPSFCARSARSTRFCACSAHTSTSVPVALE